MMRAGQGDALDTGINGLAVRRRTAVERAVLLLLRGEGPRPVQVSSSERTRREKKAQPTASHVLYFAELRRAVTGAGLAVQPVEAPYLNNDELVILGWLAQAQRADGFGGSMPGDVLLVAEIARCAGALDGLGLRLSPLTLYGAACRTAVVASVPNAIGLHSEGRSHQG